MKNPLPPPEDRRASETLPFWAHAMMTKNALGFQSDPLRGIHRHVKLSMHKKRPVEATNFHQPKCDVRPRDWPHRCVRTFFQERHRPVYIISAVLPPVHPGSFAVRTFD